MRQIDLGGTKGFFVGRYSQYTTEYYCYTAVLRHPIHGRVRTWEFGRNVEEHITKDTLGTSWIIIMNNLNIAGNSGVSTCQLGWSKLTIWIMRVLCKWDILGHPKFGDLPTITTRVCSGSLLKSSRRDPVRLAQVIRDLKTLELETQRAPETPTPKTCEYTRNTWQNAIPYTHL